MEEGFDQKGSLSSPLWSSRLSPLAQPFTMTHQGQPSQSQMTKSTPSTSNHDLFSDFNMQKSFDNLINLEDDELLVHSDRALSPSPVLFKGHSQSKFGSIASQSRFLSSTGIGDSDLVDLAVNVRGSSHLESFLEQESKVTISEVTAGTNISNKAPIFGLTNSKLLARGSYPIGNPFAHSDESSYGGNSLLKANGKGVIQEETGAVKSVFVKFSEPLTVANLKKKANSDGSKNSNSTVHILASSSAQSLDESEEDLDSPCWKGIQNSVKCFGRGFEPVYSLKNQSEVGPKLNPKAAQFIPSHSKGVLNYSSSNLLEHSLTSSGENELLSLNPTRQDCRLVDSLTARLKPPGFSLPSGYRQSSRVYDSGKDSTVLLNTETSSTDRISLDHSRGGFRKEIKDALHNIETKFPLVNTENVPNFPCSAAESLGEYGDMLQYLSHSLSSCPNINVSMMVKAIHYLSELLIQNYTPNFGSLNSNDQDMIHEIIDNLSSPLKHLTNGKTPCLGSPHMGSLDNRTRSTSILEKTNTDFGSTRSKDLVVSRKLDSQSSHKWGQSYSQLPCTKIQGQVSSSLDMTSGIQNGVVPVNRTSLKETRHVEEQFHPQALLSLWIEAQAALCTMKYENHILRIKLKMDGQK